MSRRLPTRLSTSSRVEASTDNSEDDGLFEAKQDYKTAVAKVCVKGVALISLVLGMVLFWSTANPFVIIATMLICTATILTDLKNIRIANHQIEQANSETAEETKISGQNYQSVFQGREAGEKQREQQYSK